MTLQMRVSISRSDVKLKGLWDTVVPSGFNHILFLIFSSVSASFLAGDVSIEICASRQRNCCLSCTSCVWITTPCPDVSLSLQPLYGCRELALCWSVSLVDDSNWTETRPWRWIYRGNRCNNSMTAQITQHNMFYLFLKANMTTLNEPWCNNVFKVCYLSINILKDISFPVIITIYIFMSWCIIDLSIIHQDDRPFCKSALFSGEND